MHTQASPPSKRPVSPHAEINLSGNKRTCTEQLAFWDIERLWPVSRVIEGHSAHAANWGGFQSFQPAYDDPAHAALLVQGTLKFGICWLLC